MADVIVTGGDPPVTTDAVSAPGAGTEAFVAAEEAHAEARVETARIEAERDVAIAEIRAATDRAAIDATTEAAEAGEDEDEEEWQIEMAALRSEMAAQALLLAEVTGRIEALQSALTQPSQPPPQMRPTEPIPPQDLPVEAAGPRESPAAPARQPRRLHWL